MFKKFGIVQARILIQEPDAHIPTVKATLKVIGVPNVVAAEVQKMIANAKAVVESTRGAINRILAKDAADDQSTQQKIKNLQTARAQRAQANAATVTANENAVGSQDELVQELRQLAEKFS